MSHNLSVAFQPIPARVSALRLAAIGFSAAWIGALAVPVPDVAVDAPAAGALAGHHAEVALRSLLIHGLAAAAIVVVTLALARVARPRQTVLAAGLGAAVLSMTQCVLELGFASGGNGALIEAVNRLDGVKMLALGVLALAASKALPRWLRMLSAVLAVAIFVSAAGYGLLVPALAPAAIVSLPLLLVWITGSGLTLARR